MKKKITLAVITTMMLIMTACGNEAVSAISNNMVSDNSAAVANRTVMAVTAAVYNTTTIMKETTDATAEAAIAKAEAEAKAAEEAAKRLIRFTASEESYEISLNDVTNVVFSCENEDSGYNMVTLYHTNEESATYLAGQDEILNIIDQMAKYDNTDIETAVSIDVLPTEEAYDAFKSYAEERISIQLPPYDNMVGLKEFYDAMNSIENTPESSSAPVQGNTGTMSYEEIASQMLTIVNQERAAAGLGELQWSGDLAALAQVRVVEATSSYSHTRPDGSDTPCENLNRTYGAYNLDEMAERFMRSWMDSESHRANILNPDYNYIGIAITEANGRVYGAQEFGF